jgi:hypothetical protein
MYIRRRKKKTQQQQMASHKDDEFFPAAAAASLYIIHSSIYSTYSTCMTGRPPLRRRRILYKAGDAQSSENCLEKCRIWWSGWLEKNCHPIEKLLPNNICTRAINCCEGNQVNPIRNWLSIAATYNKLAALYRKIYSQGLQLSKIIFETILKPCWI